MIEMIHLTNWDHLKSVLLTHYHNFLTENHEDGGGPTFREFVEKVFRKVLKWNTIYFDSEESESVDVHADLDIIANDDELALDILDSFHPYGIGNLEDPEYHVDVIYFNKMNSVMIEIEPKSFYLPEPNIDNIVKYRQERKEQLTKLARLLDVLRTTTDRQ